MKTLLFYPFIFMIVCVTPELGFSHKVTVFAYADGDTIRGETSFSGGRPAKGAKITVENTADGSVLLTTVTDDQGLFSFPIPDAARQVGADLRIVLLAGEAHRNEWLLGANEYLPTDIKTYSAEVATAKLHENKALVPSDSAQLDAGEEALIRQLVRELVAAELAPIRKKLLHDQAVQGPRIRDILAGIGVIFGLAGIIAYYQARKRRNS